MNNQTQIFRPNKLKNTLLFLVCSAFVLIGVYILDKDPSVGWGCIVFFGLGVIVSVIQFLPNASYLKLTDQGFEVKSLFKSNFTKWTDVEDFSRGKIKGNNMIFFNYTKDHNKWDNGKKVTKFLSGNEGAVTSSYNIKTEDLLNLMQAYKQKSN